MQQPTNQPQCVFLHSLYRTWQCLFLEDLEFPNRVVFSLKFQIWNYLKPHIHITNPPPPPPTLTYIPTATPHPTNNNPPSPTWRWAVDFSPISCGCGEVRTVLFLGCKRSKDGVLTWLVERTILLVRVGLVRVHGRARTSAVEWLRWSDWRQIGGYGRRGSWWTHVCAICGEFRFCFATVDIFVTHHCKKYSHGIYLPIAQEVSTSCRKMAATGQWPNHYCAAIPSKRQVCNNSTIVFILKYLWKNIYRHYSRGTATTSSTTEEWEKCYDSAKKVWLIPWLCFLAICFSQHDWE